MSVVRVFLAFALSFHLLATSAKAQSELAFNDFINDPFVTQTAQSNFQKCFSETTNDQLEQLSRIQRYGYSEQLPLNGCPADIPNCDPSITFVPVERTTYVTATEVGESTISSMADSLREGGCSFTSVTGFSANEGQRRLEYRFHVRRVKRVCWGDFKTNRWSADADVLVSITINNELEISSSVGIHNRSGRIFGINVDSIRVGFILGAVPPLVFAVGEIYQGRISDMLDSLQSRSNMSGTGINLYEFRNALGTLNSIGIEEDEYFFQSSLSGFETLDDEMMVRHSEVSYERSFDLSDYIQERSLELDFIRDLSQVGPKTHIVQPGDNYWGIIGETYGDTRLMSAVARMQGHDLNRTLRIGEEISLPRWQVLCERLGGDINSIVRAGDTIWGKIAEGDLPSDMSRIQVPSGNLDLIYPFDNIEFEAE